MTRSLIGVYPEVLSHANALGMSSGAPTATREDDQTAFILTADLESGRAAQNLAATHGLDLQILFPHEGWPVAGKVLFVALDELLFDARGRREFCSHLRTLTLPFPIVVLSYDFSYQTNRSIESAPLLLTVRLDDAFLRAFEHRYSNLLAA